MESEFPRTVDIIPYRVISGRMGTLEEASIIYMVKQNWF